MFHSIWMITTNRIDVFPPCYLRCVTVDYALPEVRGGTLIECNPPPGTCFPTAGNVGGNIVHPVTCRASNDRGALAQCAFSIRVIQDGNQFRNPSFEFEPRSRVFTNHCGSGCIPAAYQLPLVWYGALESCSPPPGTCLPVGTHQVICRATNECRLSASIAFNVLVFPGSGQLPVFGARDIVVTNCSTNCLVVDYPLPVVPAGASIRCTPPPGTCFPVGRSFATCVASNECGAFGNSFRVVLQRADELPMLLRVERENDAHILHWGHGCDDTGLLQTSREPDGPWETVVGARPGYVVTPSEQKRYFRLVRQ